MQSNFKRISVIGIIILIAAISRLIPHPMNFTPLGAMALFGAAYFGNKGLGLLITILSWFFSDLLLNNLVYQNGEGFKLITNGAIFIYGSIAIIFWIGSVLLKDVTLKNMVASSLSASLVFYLLSNFGVWLEGIIYPMNLDGLQTCFVRALPFFKNTVISDLFYSSILFILYELLLKSKFVKERISN